MLKLFILVTIAGFFAWCECACREGAAKRVRARMLQPVSVDPALAAWLTSGPAIAIVLIALAVVMAIAQGLLIH